jgi:uncharacterized YccA/Bax inhibitor family protein
MEFDFYEYLTEFTRYELFEAYHIVMSAVVSSVTVFMTILFAYVTVAYFVSEKLTKFQAITISSLYSLFALYIASSAYSSSYRLSIIGYKIRGVESSKDPIILGTILLAAWVFSIILFIQARRMRDA